MRVINSIHFIIITTVVKPNQMKYNLATLECIPLVHKLRQPEPEHFLELQEQINQIPL